MILQATVSHVKQVFILFVIIFIVPYHTITHNKTSESSCYGANHSQSTEKKSGHNRRNKKSKQCEQKSCTTKCETKTMSDMSLEELRTKKNECLAGNNKKIAIKYLEKMVPLCNDLHELGEIMFELANLLYDLEQYAKASAMYQEFGKLYPSSNNAEEALYKAIKSNIQLISDAERDQTTTHETIELADRFLTRPSFTAYKKEVTEIRIKCHERLLEHELSITNFYLKQGKTKSARRRLEGIRRDYIPQFSAIEPDIIYLEYELAQKEHNTEEALQKIALLEEKFPDHSSLQIVRAPKKQPFANRF